jgi:hypothetical protein
LLVAGELARYYGKPVSEILQSRYRPPVKPVKMGDFATISEDGEDRQLACGEAVTGQ